VSAGAPPNPSYRSIFVGVLLAVLLLAAVLRIADIVKLAGAALMFVPARLGLVDVVARDQVIQLDFSASPTPVDFVAAGHYLLYTNNYDLLVINDAVLESDAPPWLSATAASGDAVELELVERGLIPFDTPLARGRPVARLLIPAGGQYSLVHPRRPTQVHVVPDYITDRIGFLTFVSVIEVAIAGVAAFSFTSRRTRARRARAKALASSALSRIETSRKRQAARKDAADEFQEQNIWRPRR